MKYKFWRSIVIRQLRSKVGTVKVARVCPVISIMSCLVNIKEIREASRRDKNLPNNTKQNVAAKLETYHNLKNRKFW